MLLTTSNVFFHLFSEDEWGLNSAVGPVVFFSLAGGSTGPVSDGYFLLLGVLRVWERLSGFRLELFAAGLETGFDCFGFALSGAAVFVFELLGQALDVDVELEVCAGREDLGRDWQVSEPACWLVRLLLLDFS